MAEDDFLWFGKFLIHHWFTYTKVSPLYVVPEVLLMVGMNFLAHKSPVLLSYKEKKFRRRCSLSSITWMLFSIIDNGRCPPHFTMIGLLRNFDFSIFGKHKPKKVKGEKRVIEVSKGGGHFSAFVAQILCRL